MDARQVSYCSLTSHSTHCWSFQREPSRPITGLVQNAELLTNDLAGTSNTKYN